MGYLLVEFIELKYFTEGLGDPRLVHVSSGWDSLTWGVTLGGNIISCPVVYFTSKGVAGVDSPATSSEVIAESCSLGVTLIIILSFEFSPPHLLSL
jgi:hypothetical protein